MKTSHIWIALFIGLPTVVTPLVVSQASSSTHDNHTSFMQRAQRSFTNLFKLMSSKSMSTSSSGGGGGSPSSNGIAGNLLQSYRLHQTLCLTVAQGSVVEFASKNGAIVNAANEECLGGGGVDGAITSAGGEALAEDRYNLPKINPGIRCPTGDAKLTGPGDYGRLGVPFVIHAVGPNYMMFDEENDVETPHRLLRSAYQKSLDCTLGTPIEKVAFSLLSAGVYRGDQSLSTVLGLGVAAIRDWAMDESKVSHSKLEDVVLYAFTDREAHTLVRVCDIVLGDAARIGPPMEDDPASSSGAESDNLVEAKTEEKEDAKLDDGNGDSEQVEDTCKAEEGMESDKQKEKKKEPVEEKSPSSVEETPKESIENQEITGTEEKDSSTKA